MTFLNNLSLTQALTRVAAYLVVAAIHGFCVALLAGALGDRDPAFNGRRTLSPFVQLSVPGLIAALLFHLAWIKPVVVDQTRLRWGRGGLVAIYAGSLVVMLLLAYVLNPLRLVVTRQLTGTAALTVLGIVQETQVQSVWLALLNILPLPGLTGALLLQAITPGRTAMIRSSALVVWIALLILAALGLQALLQPAFSAIADLLIVQIS